MTGDIYAGAGRRWASGAELVYGPLATELVCTSPHSLAGRLVLDAGAGTGAAAPALGAAGARVIATDLSPAMLAWNAAARPPCAAADIRALPLPARAVDDVVAAFVLNHLADPVAGLAELARVTRPGGAILAAVFSTQSQHDARDQIDAFARERGWLPPQWYAEFKSVIVPQLGSAPAMTAAARSAGLADTSSSERPVDVGVTEAEQLVRYRLSHPVFSGWLDGMTNGQAEQLAAGAAAAIRPAMRPYRPIVVFLSARAP